MMLAGEFFEELTTTPKAMGWTDAQKYRQRHLLRALAASAKP